MIRSIFCGRTTRRPASSVTARVADDEETFPDREHEASKSAAIAMTKIWIAAANEVRRRFGSVAIKRTNNPKRRRRFALPAHSKSGLIFKIPSPLLPRDRRQAGDGIIFRKSRNSHCDLNTFSRAFKSCCNVRAGLLTFGFALQSAKSFTVARPRGILTRFPILPAFMRGTQTRLKEPGT